MAKYTVVGEGETIEVLGVLRQAGEVLSLLEKDAQPEVDRGVLVPVAEEVTEPASDGQPTEVVSGRELRSFNAETVETQPVADGDVPPTPEATVPTEPATGTEPVAPATEPVQQ